ncbi:MAG: diadenylate cyclase CdaA [Oscillospiraceae bacterium]|nr:diadenylate cyclase CdaA [Oscillospiraceae bacterium]
MQNISDLWEYVKNTVMSVRAIDVIDMILVSVIIYYAVRFIRDRRAAKLLLGILFLIAGYFLSDALQMYVLSFIFTKIFQVGILALLIVFHPEIRSLLEKVGGTSINSINRIVDQKNIQKITGAIDIISRSAAEFSALKRGSLIVIERSTKLGDIKNNSGIIVDAKLSGLLLQNIFYNRAPLHDGAVIIELDLIKAAGCFLPLSQSADIPADVGTRHRAGLGISENSDAVVVITSEETGIISLAVDGKLERNFDMYSLKKKLTDLLLENKNQKVKKTRKKADD